MGRAPLLIDEWHVVPEELGAVKRSADADPGPGRYVITGSARSDLHGPTWPGTGRVVRLPIWPMGQRELGRTTSTVGALGPPPSPPSGPEHPTRRVREPRSGSGPTGHHKLQTQQTKINRPNP